MKAYLNRQERVQMAKLICVNQAAGDIIREWTEHDNLTKDEGKYLRMGCTFIEKAAAAIIKRLGAEEAHNLIRSARELKIEVQPRETKEAYRRRLKKEAADDGIWVTVPALDNLAEMAMYACSPCRWHTAEGKAACTGRAAYLALGIPVFDNNPPDGVCPWEVRLEG